MLLNANLSLCGDSWKIVQNTTVITIVDRQHVQIFYVACYYTHYHIQASAAGYEQAPLCMYIYVYMYRSANYIRAGNLAMQTFALLFDAHSYLLSAKMVECECSKH